MNDSSSRRHPLVLVVAGGLLAGALDIAYACAYWAIKAGVPARRILQSVAAGLLGRETSVQGGWTTASLGLVLHFGIALAMAFAYYLVARRWRLLTERPVLLGALYGAFLYALMNYVVVPLSAAGGGGGGTDRLWIALSIVVHVVCVGIPIGLLAGRAARER